MSDDSDGMGPPELPDTLDGVGDMGVAYPLDFPDGSRYDMGGTRVLAVYMKYGRDKWDGWVEATRDRIAACYRGDSVPTKFGHRGVDDDEDCMAAIAEDVIYYGDLRAMLMQIALSSMAEEDDRVDDDDGPVTVKRLTGEGAEDTPDPRDVLGGGEP